MICCVLYQGFNVFYFVVHYHFLQYLAYSDSSGTELKWLAGDASSIPNGAVIGGTAPDGFPLYIILSNQAGNYDARNKSAEVNGRSYERWSWLVLIYGKRCSILDPVSMKKNIVFHSVVIPTIMMRWSWDRLAVIMVITMLVRRHSYI